MSSKFVVRRRFVLFEYSAGILAILSFGVLREYYRYIPYLPVLVAATLVAKWLFASLRLHHWYRNGVSIDVMSGLDFEKYVANKLNKTGYTNVRLTEKYDLGIDIIARKDGFNWGIQVKRYSGIVGADAVRQVVTALNAYNCDRAMVITNSTFSRPAISLARSNSCVLIDRFN